MKTIRAAFLFVFICKSSFSQSSISKIAAENAKQEVAAEQNEQAYDLKFQVVDISTKRRAIKARSYQPKASQTYVYFVNTEDEKYIKVIEKYSARNGINLINYQKLGLKNVTDEATIKKAFQKHNISGAIHFTIKKDVTEVPLTVHGWGGGGTFWGSGQFSHVGLAIAFFDDAYGDDPYLSLSGHGYTSQPNKGSKIVANEVNALMANAIKLGFLTP